MSPAVRRVRPALLFALLTGLNFLNYIDRYVLFGVQPLIQAELRVDNAAMGALTTAFFLCYMVAAPLTGAASDRWRKRRAFLLGGAFLWSAATLLTAWAHSYATLLTRHLLVGVGEATFGVLAPVYVADLYDERERGKMLALLYLAIPVGAALGYELGGWLGPRYGWRTPFYVAALPGFALALALAFWTGEPEHGIRDRLPPTRDRATWAGLWHNPGYWTATLGMAAMVFAIGGISVWMPTYLSRERGMSLAHANYLFGLITVVDGVCGTLAGGWLAERWLRRTPAAYYLVSGLSLVLCLPAAVAAVHGPAAMTLPAIAVAEFFLFLNTGPLNAAIVNSVAAPIRATALALNLFTIHLLGDAFSPTLMGFIADRASLAAAFLAAYAALAIGAAFCLFGMRFAGPIPVPDGQLASQPASGSAL